MNDKILPELKPCPLCKDRSGVSLTKIQTGQRVICINCLISCDDFDAWQNRIDSTPAEPIAVDAREVEGLESRIITGFDYSDNDISCLTISEITLDQNIFVRAVLYGDDALYVQKALENAALKPSGREEGEGWDRLLKSAEIEAQKAMVKFPQPNYVISKIAEEAGEVVKAAIHCAENRETPENVLGEMKQLIAMLYRLYHEGDQVHGLAALSGKGE